LSSDEYTDEQRDAATPVGRADRVTAQERAQRLWESADFQEVRSLLAEAENAARLEGIAQGRAEAWGEVASRAAEQWSALAYTARACRKTWGAGFTLISLHLLIPFWARATGYTPETDR